MNFTACTLTIYSRKIRLSSSSLSLHEGDWGALGFDWTGRAV